MKYPSVAVRLITFFAKVTKGVPIPKEHEMLEWVDRQELLKLEEARADIPNIKKLLDGSKICIFS